jgi:hypothetical protein
LTRNFAWRSGASAGESRWVPGQKRLLITWAGLWHQSGMAKRKKNEAAVALGRLGGLKQAGAGAAASQGDALGGKK